MQIEKLTKETILEDTTFEEIIDEKDEIYRQRLINDLTDRAGEKTASGAEPGPNAPEPGPADRVRE